VTRKNLLSVAVGAVAVVLIKLISAELSKHGVIHASTPGPVILLGAIIGMTYGLLAVGLVLIYRTNRIINFAHGQIGAFAAAFFALCAVHWHFPYWVAFPVALVVAALTGATAETAVVRRLRSAPRVVSVVATLGVGELLVVFALLINPSSSAGSLFPQPSFLPAFNVGALRVTPAYSGMLILSPVLVLVIALFLKRSRFGLAVRAAAANPDAARMAGIFASRTSSLAWAIAAVLSGFSAILTAPTQVYGGAGSFGPSLLLRALAPAVLARMQNLPQALIGGIGLGILEQVLFWNYHSSGVVELVMFVIILGALLLQKQRGGRDEEKGSWASVQAIRPLPEAYQRVWVIRQLGMIVGVVFIGLLALVPLIASNTQTNTFIGIMTAAIVGLSIGLLTGLAGQLTLGQYAIAAVGAIVSFQISRRIGDFPLALLYAAIASGVVSVLIGLPALRIRGLMLTVTTLSFGLAASDWLFIRSWAFGDSRAPGHPIVFGHALTTSHEYFYFALVIFVIALLICRNVRRGGFGRLLVAVRDNEDNARAFGVTANLVKLQGYLLAGAVAGLGGAAYAHAQAFVSPDTFPSSTSIDLVVMTVLGGVSVIAGPIIGAIWIMGLPLLNIGNIGLLGSDLGALALILWKPGGLAQLVEPIRMRVIDAIAKRAGVVVAGDSESVLVAPGQAPARTPVEVREWVAAATEPPVEGSRLLEARNLRKQFGGVVAVNDVSFVVRAGETLGLIGPNGAGKTTTFEMLGGFTKPDDGRVMFDHRDVSRLSPERRADLGLIRSFQDAFLFPTMTVKETVMLALERTSPTRFAAAFLGVTPGERRKELRARELLGMLGLDRYRDHQIGQLSTGTRRITELACLVALQPSCLLLDEPSSGVAQRETEALGELLQDLKRQLSLTLVIIEHDIPLVSALSDRMIAMADGAIIAEGTPKQVQSNSLVIDAYLGGSLTAIERSGPARPTRRKAVTV
jgi:ABC-type branched-subunit amino acid transport system ATPase component/ABC-type branched-subunit amino acid transport system permease subunit